MEHIAYYVVKLFLAYMIILFRAKNFMCRIFMMVLNKNNFYDFIDTLYDLCIQLKEVLFQGIHNCMKLKVFQKQSYPTKTIIGWFVCNMLVKAPYVEKLTFTLLLRIKQM